MALTDLQAAAAPRIPEQEARITELEIKLAYAEDLLDQLNLTVFRQQQRIDLLQQELRLLNDRLASVATQENGSLREEIPPHY